VGHIKGERKKQMKWIIGLLFALSLSGWATTVSSITCSGQTATVNSTAHGLIAGQGFSLSGSAATFNSTASTVTTNSLTFVLPAGQSCTPFTSGYTAIGPAKQIINVSSFVTIAGNITINYVSWYTTIAPTPLACNLGTSGTGCPVSQWNGASAAENAAIVAGTTIEVPGSITFAAGATSAAISTNLVSQYNAAQASYTSGFLGYAGYWWNGSAWVNH
jgi:hypothetical protein